MRQNKPPSCSRNVPGVSAEMREGREMSEKKADRAGLRIGGELKREAKVMAEAYGMSLSEFICLLLRGQLVLFSKLGDSQPTRKQ